MIEPIKLDYDFGDLEPYIDVKTMETHYNIHYVKYVDVLNKIVKEVGLMDKPIEDIVFHASNRMELNDPWRRLLHDYASGVYNHRMFFENLSPNALHVPEGELAEQINKQFGSFEKFKNSLIEEAVDKYDPGWIYLNTSFNGDLKIDSYVLFDSPIGFFDWHKDIPIMALDFWEHAYLFEYGYDRKAYMNALLELLDWKKVSERYESREWWREFEEK